MEENVKIVLTMRSILHSTVEFNYTGWKGKYRRSCLHVLYFSSARSTRLNIFFIFFVLNEQNELLASLKGLVNIS